MGHLSAFNRIEDNFEYKLTPHFCFLHFCYFQNLRLSTASITLSATVIPTLSSRLPLLSLGDLAFLLEEQPFSAEVAAQNNNESQEGPMFQGSKTV